MLFSKTRESLTLLRYTCSSVKSIECKHPPTETPLHNVGRSDQRGNKADNIACPEPAATKLRSTAAAALMQVAPQRFFIDALCRLISIATSCVDHSHDCLALFCTPLSQQALQHGIPNIACLYAAACAPACNGPPKQYRKRNAISTLWRTFKTAPHHTHECALRQSTGAAHIQRCQQLLLPAISQDTSFGVRIMGSKQAKPTLPKLMPVQNDGSLGVCLLQ